LAAALAVFLATTAEVPTGQPVRNIKCESMEGQVQHIHQHLVILDHGKSVTIPADVGRPLLTPCLYWLHTHTPDGIIHVESPNFRSFTLGDFFAIWGQPLTRNDVAGARPRAGEHVAVWVDGHPYSDDPQAIGLTQHLDVTIEVGPPYAKPAPFTHWEGL
jgi:hypothetical protein